MKSKIILIVACFLIHSTVLAMNSESQKTFTVYKDFLENINTFLSHPEDPRNHCQYLKKAQENTTFLISNIGPLAKEDDDYKQTVDNFLSITFALLFNEPNDSVFLSKLMAKVLKHIKTLKYKINSPHLNTIKQIEKDLLMYRSPHFDIGNAINFWQGIQNDFKSMYSDKNKTSAPAGIKTLLVVNIPELGRDPKLNKFLFKVKKAISFLYFDKYPNNLCYFLTETFTKEKLSSQFYRDEAIIFLQNFLQIINMRASENSSFYPTTKNIEKIINKIEKNKLDASIAQDRVFVTNLCNTILTPTPQALPPAIGSIPQSTQQEYGMVQATKNFFKSVGNATSSTINRIANFFTPTAQ